MQGEKDRSIVILDGGRRTPRADILINNREPGLFARFSTTQLGGMAITAALESTSVDKDLIGHVIMGYELSVISMFGIIALAGVVVNDSLILVHTANRNRDSGMSIFESIFNASVRRFRPIVLTSLTTFLGLAPMIFESSMQARFLIPMAISLGFGILFATGIALVLIPCLYLLLNDVHHLLRRMLGFTGQKLSETKSHESTLMPKA